MFCPRYSAQRNVLFTSAATILGETWSSSSDARKINFLLCDVKSVNHDINCALFREVQRFILSTNRFFDGHCLAVHLIIVSRGD